MLTLQRSKAIREIRKVAKIINFTIGKISCEIEVGFCILLNLTEWKYFSSFYFFVKLICWNNFFLQFLQWSVDESYRLHAHTIIIILFLRGVFANERGVFANESIRQTSACLQVICNNSALRYIQSLWSLYDVCETNPVLPGLHVLHERWAKAVESA